MDGGRWESHGTAAIETERLLLRPWTRDDRAAHARLFADPDVSRYPWGRGLTADEAAAGHALLVDHWEEHGFGYHAAVLRATGDIVGTIGLGTPDFLPEVMPAVEVGWRLHPDHWGSGLATEGARASLAVAFGRLGLDRVIAVIEPANEASWRVAERLGMRRERETRTPDISTTVEKLPPVDVLVYEITAAAWRSNGSEGTEATAGPHTST